MTRHRPFGFPVATALAAAAVILCSLAAAWWLHGAQHRPQAAGVVPILWAWGAFSHGAAYAGRRVRAPAGRWVGGVAVVALLVRAPLVGTPPLLSDDLFRYLWEGLALNAGHNPFVEAPLAVHGLDDALAARVNHGDIPSIYPPVALWWFRALAAVAVTPWLVQLGTALADTVTAALLASWASRRGGAAWPALLYALHPLPAVESAHGAHLDLVAVPLAVAAVLLSASRPGPASFAALVGAGIKLFPALLLAPILRRGPRAAVRGGALALLLLAILALPVLDAGPRLGAAMGTYASTWSFNGLVFPWIEAPLGRAARPLLVATGAAVVAWAWMRRADPASCWLLIGSAFVLLSPTVHPWYAIWALVPALLCERWGWSAAGVALLGSYTVLWAYDPTTRAWAEAPWLWWITWPPAGVALAIPLARRSLKVP